MSLINFPPAVDTFPTINSAGGDNLNTPGKEHDVQHNKTTQAVAAIEKVVVGPTQYNVAGYPQSTFDGRWAAALADALSSGGKMVVIPGNYTSAGMGTITKPTVSVDGPGGSSATVINYTGSGDCLLWQDSPATIEQHGSIKGITIIGNSNANAVGLHCLDCAVMPALDDIVLSSFNGTSGIGLRMQNVSYWSERAHGTRVHLDRNTVGMRMEGVTGATSFSYHRWLDLRLNVNSGQIGIQSKGSAFVFGGIWNILCNGGGGTSIGIDAADTSVWSAPLINFQGESLGTGARVAPGAIFNPTGLWAPGAADIGLFNTGTLYDSLGRIIANAALPPTCALAAGAGSGAVVTSISGNQTRGAITFNAGSGGTTGKLITVTYLYPFAAYSANIPTPDITPLARASAGLQLALGPGAYTNSGFEVECNVAPTNGVAYGFTYHVIG